MSSKKKTRGTSEKKGKNHKALVNAEMVNADQSINSEYFKHPKSINEMMKDISQLSLENASPVNITLKSQDRKANTSSIMQES